VRVDITQREEVAVGYRAVEGTPEAIPAAAHRAWQELEAAISPHGRKMYGYWDPARREYLACYALQEDDDPEALGLGRGVLPGGVYRRARLKGEGVFDQIARTFDKLAAEGEIDETRPWVEFYRRHDEVDLLVPIETG
jgi:DNA gyrase inhibitor GyrI